MSLNKWAGIRLLQFVIMFIIVIWNQQILGISRDLFDTVAKLALLIGIDIVISGAVFLTVRQNIWVQLGIVTVILIAFYFLMAESFLISLGLGAFEAGLLWILVLVIELYEFWPMLKVIEQLGPR